MLTFVSSFNRFADFHSTTSKYIITFTHLNIHTAQHHTNASNSNEIDFFELNAREINKACRTKRNEKFPLNCINASNCLSWQIITDLSVLLCVRVIVVDSLFEQIQLDRFVCVTKRRCNFSAENEYQQVAE